MNEKAPHGPALLTLRQAADRLNVNKRTVQRWIEKGLLRVVRFGRTVRIHEADLEDVIDAHRS